MVPVGLTRFRPNQDELIPVTPEKAQEIITQVQNLQQKFQQELGSTCVWIADELFLIAGAELPPNPIIKIILKLVMVWVRFANLSKNLNKR